MTSRTSALLIVCALLALSPCAAAGSGTPPPAERNADAFSMLQEEQTVTAATKRPQPLSETPSEVTVITASEIHAMGYHTLADALRWVRGLYVSDDRNYSYLGVRGLQRPGDYNNKVLLAIDGHTLNGNPSATPRSGTSSESTSSRSSGSRWCAGRAPPCTAATRCWRW